MSSEPSIGHPVHYVSYGTPGGEYESQCRAAFVTEVHSVNEGVVGLAVLNPTGMFFDRDVPYDHNHSGGSWHWPCARQSLTGVVQPDGSTITAEENPE